MPSPTSLQKSILNCLLNSDTKYINITNYLVTVRKGNYHLCLRISAFNWLGGGNIYELNKITRQSVDTVELFSLTAFDSFFNQKLCRYVLSINFVQPSSLFSLNILQRAIWYGLWYIWKPGRSRPVFIFRCNSYILTSWIRRVLLIKIYLLHKKCHFREY